MAILYSDKIKEVEGVFLRGIGLAIVNLLGYKTGWHILKRVHVDIARQYDTRKTGLLVSYTPHGCPAIAVFRKVLTEPLSADINTTLQKEELEFIIAKLSLLHG